jgi:AcrR family transcriptional regulator
VARYTSEHLCARIFQRHADRIRVKKPHVAVANLVRIVDAFLKLSVRKGFHATSLRDLAEASGLSMGGLYSYFDSKETLLVMVLEEVDGAVAEVFSMVPEAVAAHPTAHLAWAIEAHLRLTEVMQPWFNFAYMEAKSFPTKARSAAVESELVTERTIADILQRGVEQGAFDIGDVQLTAALVKPMLQDWYVKRSKYRRRGTTLDSYIRTVTSFVQRAVGRHGALSDLASATS